MADVSINSRLHCTSFCHTQRQDPIRQRQRRSAHFSANGEIGSISGYFKNGASGPSHKLYLSYWLTKSLGLGLMEDSTGRGLRVAVRLGEKANL